MPSLSVAVVGEVIATCPSNFLAGPVLCTAYPDLTINGKNVIYRADCTFTETSSGVTTSVALVAMPTALQAGKNNVLRNGDIITTAGLTLQVQCGNHLYSG